jgi:hypothetical protein
MNIIAYEEDEVFAIIKESGKEFKVKALLARDVYEGDERAYIFFWGPAGSIIEGEACFWHIYVYKPSCVNNFEGYLYSELKREEKEIVKKVWSPLMSDPYGKGPEGETLGPSGLSFL